jgi:hypothetical protein
MGLTVALEILAACAAVPNWCRRVTPMPAAIRQSDPKLTIDEGAQVLNLPLTSTL